MNNRELEARLITFSVEVIRSTAPLRKKPTIMHLVDQVNRSASSTALNYGEAQSAESKKDFIHKIGIVMKELRETFINLSIISRLENDDVRLKELLKENDELIAIFYKTLTTAKSST